MEEPNTVCFHLFPRFFCGPTLFGHPIRCDHHSGAVVANTAVDENRSLHKQALQETTVLEQVQPGKPYPKMESSFICPVSQKVFMIPEF